MKLLGISGTITGSKTIIVLNKLLQEVNNYDPSIKIETLDLKNYNVQFCDGREPSTYEGDTKKVIELVQAADFYLIGTPVFQGSMTGALKNLLDLVPISAMRNKVIGFFATGGTYQHYLVIENQLKPVAGYLRAYVAPSYVYAHRDHFNQHDEIVDEEVLERIGYLAREIVDMQKALKSRG